MMNATTRATRTVASAIAVGSRSYTTTRCCGNGSLVAVSNSTHILSGSTTRNILLSQRCTISSSSRLCNRAEEGSSSSKPYVSPFASFFDNIQKGRTSTHLPNEGPTLRSQHLASTPRLKCGISEEVLRFKTESFFRQPLESPFVIPGEHQIQLFVTLDDIPLPTNLEKKIFLQLIGGTRLKRYNPKTRVVKLRSHQFASRIENKRHVCSMLDRLVFAAQELAAEKVKANNNKSPKAS